MRPRSPPQPDCLWPQIGIDGSAPSAQFTQTWPARSSFATRDVIVDLSELTFADPSLMIDLACLAQRLRANGVTLWLAHPQPNIRMLIETVGLHRLPAVRVDGGNPAFT